MKKTIILISLLLTTLLLFSNNYSKLELRKYTTYTDSSINRIIETKPKYKNINFDSNNSIIYNNQYITYKLLLSFIEYNDNIIDTLIYIYINPSSILISGISADSTTYNLKNKNTEYIHLQHVWTNLQYIKIIFYDKYKKHSFIQNIMNQIPLSINMLFNNINVIKLNF